MSERKPAEIALKLENTGASAFGGGDFNAVAVYRAALPLEAPVVKKLCPQLEAHEAAALRPANDSKPVFTRLSSFAVRGCHLPDTLTPYEIRQISFGLLSRLLLEEKS